MSSIDLYLRLNESPASLTARDVSNLLVDAITDPCSLVTSRDVEDSLDALAASVRRASPEVAMSFADAACDILERLGSISTQRANTDLGRTIELVSAISDRLDGHRSIKLIMRLSHYLCSENQRIRGATANCLAGINHPDALSILEGAPEPIRFSEAVLPALFTQRAQWKPADLFNGAQDWFESTIRDPFLRIAFSDACVAIIRNSPKSSRLSLIEFSRGISEHQYLSFKNLMDEVNVSIGDIVNKNDKSSEFGSSESFTADHALFALIDNLKSLSSSRLPQSAIQFFDDLRDKDPDTLKVRWPIVSAMASDLRNGALSNFTYNIKYILFSNPTKFTSELWFQFYDSLSHFRVQKEGSPQVVRENVSAGFASVIRSAKKTGVLIPQEIRIASAPFAEEAYLEALRIAILCEFPSIKFEVVHGVDWNDIDQSFKNDRIHLSLGNDDILAYAQENRDIELVRLNTELYKLGLVPMIAHRATCVDAGLLSEFGAPINKLNPQDEASLAEFLRDRRIFCIKDSALQQSLTNLLRNIGVKDSCIDPAVSPNQAAALFAEDRNSVLFCGAIHQNFFLDIGEKFMRFGSVDFGTKGYIFASRKFYDDYSDFLKLMPGLVARINDVLKVASQNSEEARNRFARYALTQAVRSAASESEYRTGGFAPLTFAELQQSLGSSQLTHRDVIDGVAWVPFGYQESKNAIELLTN